MNPSAALKDRVVVITGSTRGFGRIVARMLLEAGATVVISGRSQVALDKMLAKLRPLGTVEGWSCDVRDETEVYALASRAAERFGRIDVWINNAGFSAANGLLMDHSPESILDMFLTNDMGTWFGTQAALRLMEPRGAGVIVNLYGAGSNGKAASPMGMYATTKAWVTSFTRTLAVEIAGSGVRLIGFSPGMMLTDMLRNPHVLGDRGVARLENYGFVLRFLAKPPEIAAQALVRAIERALTGGREFTEVRVMKPWTPMLGLVRVALENLTGRARTPEYTLHMEDAYVPAIAPAPLSEPESTPSQLGQTQR